MKSARVRPAAVPAFVFISILATGSVFASPDLPGAWNIEKPRAEQVSLDREFTEGTWMNVDVSPDGRHIAFDLLGHLYEMPASGGNATALTSGRSINLLPRYSPDGTRIAFTSDRDGVEDLWILERVSGKLTKLTDSKDRVLSAGWSADGRFLYGTMMRTSAMTMTPMQFDLYGGRQQLFESAGYGPLGLISNYRDRPARNQLFFDFVNEDLPASGGYIVIYDKSTGERSIYRQRPGGAVAPALSPDGRHLAYIHREDVDTQLILHDLDTRTEQVLLKNLVQDRQETFSSDLHGPYPTMSWMPDGKAVVLWHRGGIYSVDISTEEARRIAFRARVTRSMDKTIRFKAPVPDEQASTRVHRWAQRTSRGILFEALGDLYLKTDRETRNLTRSQSHETSPLYDEDSHTLYYASWSDDELGSIHQQKLPGGKPRKLTTRPSQYGALTLSPDGHQLAFLREDGRLQEGELLDRQSHFELIVLNLQDGKERLVSPVYWDYGYGVSQLEMPSVRFSPDGRQLYFSELIKSTLRLERIDIDGRQKTELYRFPKASRAEVSPDGRWIAYQEYHRNYLTPFSYIGKPITVSADEGTGTSLRIDAEHDGLYHRWSRDSRSLMWARGGEFIEKAVAEIVAGSGKVTSTPLAVTFQVDKPTSVIALKGARVITIDPRRRVLENTTLLVRGNRIAAIGADVDIPKDAKVFELQGRTIMPGLVDAHAHLKSTTGAIMKMPALGVIEQRSFVLNSNLAYGVTTLYEVAGTVDKDFWMSDMLLKGSMTGPRLYSVGTILCGMQRFLERSYRSMNSYQDVLEHVRFNKAFGATALKEYMVASRRVRQQVAAAARAEGLNLVIEPGYEANTNISRLIDGATELAHDLVFTAVYDDYVRMFAANRMGITSTTTPEPDHLNALFSQARMWEDPKLNRFARREALRPRMRRPQHVFDDDLVYRLKSAGLKKLYDAGVPIQMGGHGELLGMDLHYQMEAHALGGFTNMEALAVTTIGGAWNQGLDHAIGSLETGKMADLIILNGNPLDDIRNTHKIELVMKNGVLYSGADAARVFPDPRPAGQFYFKRNE